jgi:hypothetical protein
MHQVGGVRELERMGRRHVVPVVGEHARQCHRDGVYDAGASSHCHNGGDVWDADEHDHEIGLDTRENYGQQGIRSSARQESQRDLGAQRDPLRARPGGHQTRLTKDRDNH